jgi:translation initiation factor eIF-2B subunit delta
MSSSPQNQHKFPRPPSLSLQPNGTAQIDQPSSGTAPKSQKQMTKAERREMQERQRAAKAAKAATTGPQTGGPTAKPPRSAASTSPNLKKSGRGSESPLQTRGSLVAGPSVPSSKNIKESKAAAAAEEAAGRSRGLRIFSHFALQKPVVLVTKGDVHPAIVRLGLMFADFKICGANARCIATLSIFKRVGRPRRQYGVATLIDILGRSYKTTQPHQTTLCQDTS